MRIIAGRYKGRRLVSPPGMQTRPILDRVKASLFDWLGSRLAMPGELPALHVCDLYCGAGSQGIEALSRGAASCTFVETDPAALRCLRENLSRTGIGSEAVIAACPVETAELSPETGDGFGLVFLDPPYRLSEAFVQGSTLWRVVGRLGGRIATTPDAVLLWRHPAGIPPRKDLPGSWRLMESRTWANMAVTLYQSTATPTT